ncbi:MAG: AraC family transcriptional regulator [Spirochaetaceae bacterium]|nr:MAG: AraC family transcriptional regulator [Spirochaetaceae bacterium]
MRAQLERVEVKRGHSFFAADYPIRRRLDHEYHHHPELEIALVVGMSGTLQCGATTSSFRSGQLFLLGPNVPHRFTGTLPHGSAGRAFVVQLRPDWLGERFLALPETFGFRDLVERSRLGLSLRDPDSRIRRRLTAVTRAEGMSRLVHLLSLIATMVESPGWTEVTGAPLRMKRQTRDISRIQTLQDTLRERFRDQIEEAAIAELLGFTRTSFCRWIRSVTGRTFTEILNDHRIANAVLLLQQTDLPVARVALECGYGSLSHFYREFRRRQKSDPSAVRRSSRLDGS